MDGSQSKPKKSQRLLSKTRTRRKLLAAALQLFKESGYEAATIRDIAREAGMSTGAVFANFRDKADLFEQAVIPELESLRRRLRTGFAVAKGTLYQRLSSVFSAEYREQTALVPLLRIVFSQLWLRSENDYPLIRQEVEKIIALVNLQIVEAKARKEVSHRDTTLLAKLVWESYLVGLQPTRRSNGAVRASFDLRLRLLLAPANFQPTPIPPGGLVATAGPA